MTLRPVPERAWFRRLDQMTEPRTSSGFETDLLISLDRAVAIAENDQADTDLYLKGLVREEVS